MRRNLVLTFASLLVLLVTAAHAETVAVAVRHHSEQDGAPALAETVEQGAMDFLFGSGQIVFDQSLDAEDELYYIRSMLAAEAGGAAYSVVFELDFATPAGRGFEPHSVTAVAFDVETEDEIGRSTLFAMELEKYSELDAEIIADRLGRLAAEAALSYIRGGNSSW